MKKTLTLLSFVGLVSFSANAQWCGSVATETPNTSVTTILSPSSADLPCAVQGEAYYEVITFKVPYQNFPSPIGPVDIDSLEWVSIDNLPCGLCWKLDRSSQLYGHDNYGVIVISGTTSDVVGQYDLVIRLRAKLETETQWEPEIYESDIAGITLSMRVAASSNSCAPYSTNPGRHASCVTGIDEVNTAVHALSVVPNPVNTTATVNFDSEKSADYTLFVTDILGKQLLNKTVKAVAGSNTTTIERNNIPQGIYFVNITDGKSTVTRKFVIAD